MKGKQVILAGVGVNTIEPSKEIGSYNQTNTSSIKERSINLLYKMAPEVKPVYIENLHFSKNRGYTKTDINGIYSKTLKRRKKNKNKKTHRK